jgi:glycosyltransferase involved in cell wall biosynthesis
MATKMYASAVCGTPVVYAGIGPGRAFAAEPGVGWGVDYDPVAVADAMRAALDAPRDEAARRRLAAWAAANVSLEAVARRAVEVVGAVLARRGRAEPRG